MLHAIYLMKFSLYLQAKMSGMSKCRHDEMALYRHPIIPPSRKKRLQKSVLRVLILKPGLLQHE